jgi:hypothetical protein
VDDLCPALFDLLQVGLRVAAGGLDDADALVDDDVDEAAVVLRNQRRQEGHIHPEGAVGEGAGASDSVSQSLRRFEGQSRQNTETARVRNRGHQLGLRNPHHPALDDRMLDPEILSYPRFEYLRHGAP